MTRRQTISNRLDVRWDPRRSARRLSAIVQSSPSGICLIDRKYSVLYANIAWAKMHGYVSPGELIGCPVRTFHTETQMKEEVYPFLEMVRLVGQYARTIHHARRDQSEFAAQTVSSLMRDEDGEWFGYVQFASVTNEEPETRPAEDGQYTLEYE
ncbi:MAG: PAS domain-containing protein [Phycisphaerae bacterium]|nr:PAS domain-containing protein [Phycisphaerae bacterium]